MTGCWLWTAATTRKYGRMHFGGKLTQAHRISWTLNRGDIPSGMNVCHHCDTPPCVNPDHLFLGTQADNIRDAYRKGRVMTPGERAFGVGRVNKTHCKHGHPLLGANLYRRPDGKRDCRECARATRRRWREKR